MTVFPEDPGLKSIYGPTPPKKEDSAEFFLGVPTVIPAVTAGLQAAEAINILLGKTALARGRLVHLDLSRLDIESFMLGQAGQE